MLTQERVRELFTYDPDTGHLFWREQGDGAGRTMQMPLGVPASGGYLYKKVDRCTYLVHRLVWLWLFGYMPAEVDHINGNRADNRQCNLREASSSENQWNKGRQSNNTSGHKGVSWFAPSNKWMVQVRKHGIRMHSYHTTLEDAAQAAQEYRELLHGRFVNHGGT